jgi:hypothetical protein
MVFFILSTLLLTSIISIYSLISDIQLVLLQSQSKFNSLIRFQSTAQISSLTCHFKPNIVNQKLNYLQATVFKNSKTVADLIKIKYCQVFKNWSAHDSNFRDSSTIAPGIQEKLSIQIFEHELENTHILNWRKKKKFVSRHFKSFPEPFHIAFTRSSTNDFDNKLKLKHNHKIPDKMNSSKSYKTIKSDTKSHWKKIKTKAKQSLLPNQPDHLYIILK